VVVKKNGKIPKLKDIFIPNLSILQNQFVILLNKTTYYNKNLLFIEKINNRLNIYIYIYIYIFILVTIEKNIYMVSSINKTNFQKQKRILYNLNFDL
jgi:hypothetical protein